MIDNGGLAIAAAEDDAARVVVPDAVVDEAADELLFVQRVDGYLAVVAHDLGVVVGDVDMAVDGRQQAELAVGQNAEMVVVIGEFKLLVVFFGVDVIVDEPRRER